MQAVSAKPILIIARTAVEAAEHAVNHGLMGFDWRFAANADDLLGKTPATHELVFTDNWRGRQDAAAIHERARDLGFRVPR
jgi:hypothetical protein